MAALLLKNFFLPKMSRSPSQFSSETIQLENVSSLLDLNEILDM